MDAIERRVLGQYGRFLAHMRAEKDDRRFGLVLGAGVSQPLRFPSWSELVARIAEHPEVDGKHVVAGAGSSLPDTSKTQMLFQHYRSKIFDTVAGLPNAKLVRFIQGKWRRIIHECLYRDVPTTSSELRNEHPYLRNYIDVITKSVMTVNYNFDDTIQQILLLESPTGGANSVRSFETVWNAYLPFRNDTPIIYHPNGFLPRNLLEYPSENLVFSEDSFADQLIESMAGHHASLLHHFSKTTCLLIGLSLHDATLRHLLRRSAVINPGHYHYYIHWRDRSAVRDSSAEKALRDANFEVFNLVTLFLDDDEISALGRLLATPEDELRREADELGVKLKYFYYLTGAVGAGKTSCLSYLGSFKAYEEWAEARPIELGKAWVELSDDERERLDAWVIRQFDLKNCRLRDQRIGIHVIDRTPLDPLAFTEIADMQSKATAISAGLSPGQSLRRPVNGHIVLLTGQPEDMEVRVIGRHKQSQADVIRGMQSILMSIFDHPTVSLVNTFGLSISQVVKLVSKIIYFGEYSPLDLSSILLKIENGEFESERGKEVAT